MAAMMLMLINFNNAHSLAAISWPTPLISQLFSPRLFKATPFLPRSDCSIKVSQSRDFTLAWFLLYNFVTVTLL